MSCVSGLSSSMAHTSGYMSMSNTAPCTKETSPLKQPLGREPLKPIQEKVAPPMEVDVVKVTTKDQSTVKDPPKVTSPMKKPPKEISPVPPPPKQEPAKSSSSQVVNRHDKVSKRMIYTLGNWKSSTLLYSVLVVYGDVI